MEAAQSTQEQVYIKRWEPQEDFHDIPDHAEARRQNRRSGNPVGAIAISSAFSHYPLATAGGTATPALKNIPGPCWGTACGILRARGGRAPDEAIHE